MTPSEIYQGLSTDQRESLVGDSIMFMRTITEVFGADMGQRIWDRIADEVDPCLKQDILMSMLMGHTGRRIRFRRGPIAHEAVSVIKAIRTATGLGLKEAKDLWDASAYSWAQVDVEDREQARTLLQDLRQFGMIIQ